MINIQNLYFILGHLKFHTQICIEIQQVDISEERIRHQAVGHQGRVELAWPC